MVGLIFAVGLLSPLVAPQRAYAGEGGIQVYVPAVYGSLRLALVPGKGLYYLNLTAFARIKADILPSGGEVWSDLDMFLFFNTFTPLYVTGAKILGGTYFFSAGFPLVYFDVSASIADENGESIQTDDLTSLGFSDIYAIPFGLSWQNEQFHVFFYEGINIPVGKYELGNPHNIGLNHWAFDTNIGFTWMVPKSGFEIDLDVGYIFNTRNTATDYLSGQSFHLDYTLGYGGELFAAGFSGYWYQQVTGDTGTGATLGSFKGMGVGIGASASYTFQVEPEPIVLTAEWITDLKTENRWKGNWITLMLVIGII